MVSKLLLCLLVGVAVLALTTQAAPTDVTNGTVDNPEITPVDKTDDVFDEDEIDEVTEIDGIVLRDLTVDQLHELLEDEDNQVSAELDLDVVKNELLRRQSETRRKRSVPAIVGKALSKAARTLFKSAKVGRVTTSGARITRQYQRFGNFNDALRDFNRFRPDNLKSFNGKISGRTGTVGNHRITVRNGSSNGSPTLEIRSNKARGEYVRKFRYYNP